MLSELPSTLRALGRSPLFAVATTATLAVGLGATTAIVSLVNAVILAPLPYANPGQLMIAHEAVSELADRYPLLPANPRSIVAWESGCRATCDGLAALYPSTVTLTGRDDPTVLEGLRVSPELLDVLGVRPVLGRTFRADEDVAGRDRVIILSHALWQAQFAGDPAIVGQSLLLDGDPVEVVGVLPSSFYLPRLEELYPIPLRTGTAGFLMPLVYPPERLRSPGEYDYAVILRMESDATPEQTQAELTAITEAEFVDAPVHPRPVLRALHDQIVGDVRGPLWLLLAAVITALLVACVNVANLVAVRWLDRGRELAIRTAVGASAGRLARQIVGETMLLAAIGGIGGLLVARVAVEVLLASAPVDLPRAAGARLDVQVLLFAVIVTLACGLVCACLPVWRVYRSNLAAALNAESRSTGEGARIQTMLVGAQAALTTVLLVAGALLVASFVRLLQVDRGFDETRVLVADVRLPAARYRDGSDRARFYDELLPRLAALPGAVVAGLVQRLPLEGESTVDLLASADDTRPMVEVPVGNYRFVSPDYPDAMGMVLTRGRMFDAGDRGRRVGVVTETTARTLWPARDPLGQRFRRGNAERVYEVVGVVADARIVRLERDSGLVAYLPYWDQPPGQAALVVRSRQDPAGLTGALREAVRSIDPDLPLQDVRTMSGIVARAVAGRRFLMSLAVLFAMAGLLLVCLGVYGVVAAMVARRRSEIAVRLALGATVPALTVKVGARGLWPVLAGVAVGIAASVAARPLIAGLLFDVSPGDPAVLAGAALLMLAVSVVACVVPAARATRVSPAGVLRGT